MPITKQEAHARAEQFVRDAAQARGYNPRPEKRDAFFQQAAEFVADYFWKHWDDSNPPTGIYLNGLDNLARRASYPTLEARGSAQSLVLGIETAKRVHGDTAFIDVVQLPDGSYKVIVDAPEYWQKGFHGAYQNAVGLETEERLRVAQKEISADGKKLEAEEKRIKSEIEAREAELSKREKDIKELKIYRGEESQEIFFLSPEDATKLGLKEDADYKINKLKTGEPVLMALNEDAWDLLKSYENQGVAREDARLARIEQELLKKGETIKTQRGELKEISAGLVAEREELGRKRTALGEREAVIDGDERFLAGWAEKLIGKKGKLAKRERKYKLDAAALAQAEEEFLRREHGLYSEKERVGTWKQKLGDYRDTLAALAGGLAAREKEQKGTQERLDAYAANLKKRTTDLKIFIRERLEEKKKAEAREGELKFWEKNLKAEKARLDKTEEGLRKSEEQTAEREAALQSYEKELKTWDRSVEAWKADADAWGDECALREGRVEAAEASLNIIGEELLKREQEADLGRRVMPAVEIMKRMYSRGTFNAGIAVDFVRHLLGMPRTAKKIPSDNAEEAAFYEKVRGLKGAAKRDSYMRARVIQTQLEKLPSYLRAEVFGRYPELELNVLESDKAGELNSYFAELGNLGEMAPVDCRDFEEVRKKMPEPHKNRVGAIAVYKDGKVSFADRVPRKTIEAYLYIAENRTLPAAQAESRVPREPDGTRVVFHDGSGGPDKVAHGEPLVEFKPVTDEELNSKGAK